MVSSAIQRTSAPAATDAAERRALPRVAFDLPVDLYMQGLAGSLPARTRDLGVGGVCIVTPTRFAISSLRRLCIIHPMSRLQLAAEACWQTEAPGEYGFFTGIRFLDPDPGVADQLWDLVADQTKAVARSLDQASGLEALTLGEAIELAQRTRLRELRLRRCLYKQGDSGSEGASIFVIAEGEMVLEVRSRKQRRLVVSRLQRGHVLGGFGSLAPTETAVADGGVVLFEISPGAFANLRRTNPGLALRLASAAFEQHLARLQSALVRILDAP
jgi:CRP-like cAMP-binding protein